MVAAACRPVVRTRIIRGCRGPFADHGRRGLRPQKRITPALGKELGPSLLEMLCSGGQAQNHLNTVSRISNLYAGLRASCFRKVRLEAFWHLRQIVLVGVIADRAGHAGRSAPTLPRTEPRPIGMRLADPPTIVASRTELHRM